MPNISKKKLPDGDLIQLFLQLNKTISQLKITDTNDFLQNLLGKEERVMLAKRFAIIIMITEGFSTYQIAQKLLVSSSTVHTIHTKHKQGKYDQLLSYLQQNKKSYLNIWETLDSILHLGGTLPHYNGLDRYKSL